MVHFVNVGFVSVALATSRRYGPATKRRKNPMIKTLLKRLEGLRLHPYDDNGDQSIGYGRNLSSVGITEPEAAMLLDNDVNRCEQEVRGRYEYYDQLSEIRQTAVLSLAYQLGSSRHALFHNHHAEMAKGNFVQAAKEIYPDSLYARQVPSRAEEIAKIIETNEIFL